MNKHPCFTTDFCPPCPSFHQLQFPVYQEDDNTNLDKHIKKQRDYFASKGPSSQGYGFSSSHVWM